MSSLSASTSSSVSSLTPRSDLIALIASSNCSPAIAVGDVAEHLHEAAVGVPGEALVLRGPREALDGGVVEAQVEHRVEHPGHRLARAGADGDEQRVLVVAERLAGALLQALERLVDLLGHPVGLGLAVAHVGDARLGGDREARRDTVLAEHARHLGDVGALAAEQLAHVPRALGEVVDPLRQPLRTSPASRPTPGSRGRWPGCGRSIPSRRETHLSRRTWCCGRSAAPSPPGSSRSR